jgi:hypothetical protein
MRYECKGDNRIILVGLKKFECKMRAMAVEYKGALFTPIHTMCGQLDKIA